MATPEHLQQINMQMPNLSAEERIQWAAEVFPSGLYALTSAGIDSGVMLDFLSQAPRSIPVIHIDTGFVPDETMEYRSLLQQYYEFELHEFAPDISTILTVQRDRLWETDLEGYSRLTKVEPLIQGIRKLGVQALLSAVRWQQTENRAALDFIGEGLAGELRIHPLLDWTDQDIRDLKKGRHIPEHKLYYRGFGSVDDTNLMQMGDGREGRDREECGLHTADGRPIRRKELEE